MKKSYTTPEISVVLFENEDIVTTSDGGLLDALTNSILGMGDVEADFGLFGEDNE